MSWSPEDWGVIDPNLWRSHDFKCPDQGKTSVLRLRDLRAQPCVDHGHHFNLVWFHLYTFESSFLSHLTCLSPSVPCMANHPPNQQPFGIYLSTLSRKWVWRPDSHIRIILALWRREGEGKTQQLHLISIYTSNLTLAYALQCPDCCFRVLS